MLNKKLLRDHCVALLKVRIEALAAKMANAQAAANEETKSSAGDKYETARAMNQLEKEMLGRQYAENRKELAAMISIDISASNETIRAGSLVRLDHMYIFLLGGLGKLNVESHTVFVVSPNAPLAGSIIGKKKGDMILFNKQTMEVLEIL